MKNGYILKRSVRARSLRVSVYPDGRVVVAAPAFLGLEAVEKFLAEHSGWISRTLQKFMPFRPMIKRKNSRVEYQKHKEAARKLVLRRIPELNRTYGFKVGRIAIRNQKSRWGSCSASGNLNFNYRLALIDPRLADYVIVHELCHLAEMNHGKGFWSLVGKAMPDYKELRSRLKETRFLCI